MPSSPHPNPDGHQRGRQIERRLYEYLIHACDDGLISAFFQPDACAIRADGRVFFIEVKNQERFEAPPFEGHGLPVKQAQRAQRVRLATRVPTLLMVFDGGDLYLQWIHVLERGRHFDTAGTIKTPRRIYDLSSFARRSA